MQRLATAAGHIAVDQLLGKSSDKNKLEVLEKELRKDEITATTERVSSMAGNFQEPTPEQREQQHYLKSQSMPVVNATFNNVDNKLADFSMIIKQMYSTNGLTGTAVEAMLMTTLDGRRDIERVTDDTQDGYDFLANTFGLVDKSKKQQKKKKPKLNSTWLY